MKVIHTRGTSMGKTESLHELFAQAKPKRHGGVPLQRLSPRKRRQLTSRGKSTGGKA